MTTPRQDWQFGRIYTPDEAWLARAAPEPVLDPELPIVDPHHHLWQRGDHRYFLDELLADLNTGHNIVATVFLECRSMYRADGPAELRPLGETEFVAGTAAMSDSGGYGRTRIAAGIVGYADLTLGDRVEPVLEAHLRAGGGRFRGVRHSAGWDADPVIGNSRPDTQPHLYQRADFREGLARLTRLGLSFDAWLYHPQLGDVV
jgi:predicted TIM-barrel fold metal-dependent hydrolase